MEQVANYGGLKHEKITLDAEGLRICKNLYFVRKHLRQVIEILIPLYLIPVS